MPIPCVDVIVHWKGKLMLVKRRNEPMRDAWWVPGGRVLIGEDITSAARRKTREDLGIEIEDVVLAGVYADVYDQGPFGAGPYHSISTVFEARAVCDAVSVGAECAGWMLSAELPPRLKQKLLK